MVPRTSELQLASAFGRTLLVALGLFAPGCHSNDATTVDAGTDLGRDAGQVVPDLSSDGGGATDTDASAPTEGCNPLGTALHCLLPYPSNAFLTDGAVELGAATPRDKFGAPVLAFDHRPIDGFSVMPSIVFSLDVPLDADSTVGWNATETSVSPTSPTILLDATTGEAVPHFSEVYLGGDDSVERLYAAIRPLNRLEHERRYIVAVQDLTTEGVEADALPNFAQLRDSQPSDGLARYDSEIFEPLEAHGVDRSNLQLAWDFTTRSESNLTQDMFDVRDGTLEWLETNEPTVTIREVNEGDDRETWLTNVTHRHVEGTFTAPLWMTENTPGSRLAGNFGAREIVGTTEVDFTIAIPLSIADGTFPATAFIQYGHGFFGEREEVISFVQADFANESGFVMGAVDWQGMAIADRDWVVPAIVEDPKNAFGFVHRIHQGMANQLVFTHVVQNLLADDPALTIDGERTYDPTQMGFLGISQGHILGGTFAALTPSIERIALNVGGASFGLILTRSYAFLLFERVLAQWFEGPDLLAFEAVAPLVLEPVDPIAYAPFVVTRPPSDAAPRQILLQGGLGDTAVPTVGMELHARALGIPLLTPTAATVPFIETSDGPVPSALTLVDYDVDGSIAREWKPVNMDTATHEGIRRMPTMRAQMQRFFAVDGVVENTCGGPCVREE